MGFLDDIFDTVSDILGILPANPLTTPLQLAADVIAGKSFTGSIEDLFSEFGGQIPGLLGALVGGTAIPGLFTPGVPTLQPAPVIAPRAVPTSLLQQLSPTPGGTMAIGFGDLAQIAGELSPLWDLITDIPGWLGIGGAGSPVATPPTIPNGVAEWNPAWGRSPNDPSAPPATAAPPSTTPSTLAFAGGRSRLIPYVQGMIIPSGYYVAMRPGRRPTAGYAAGTYLVKRRRMNPLNVHALNRSTRRVHSATKLVKRLFTLPRNTIRRKKRSK